MKTKQPPSLFDSITIAVTGRINRPTDPVTSRLAGEHIATKLPDLQRRMLHAFAVARTANEAAAWCVSQDGGNHESLRKRTHELADKDLIVMVSRRRCEVTGMAADVWRTK